MDQYWVNAGVRVADFLGSGTFLVLATALAVFSGLWIFQEQNGREKKARGVVFPPGSVGWPYVISDTLAILKGHKRNDLKTFFDQKAAKYGPIFKLSFMGETCVLLDPPAGNRFIFGTEYKLLQKAYPKSIRDLLAGDCLLFMKGDRHKFVRRHLSSKFLGPDSIRRYVAHVERNVLEHMQKYWLGKVDTGEEICTLRTITKFTMELILDVCFGLTIRTQKAEVEKLSHAFQVWAHGLLSFPINVPGFAFHRALQAREVLNEVIDDLIVKRKQELKEGAAIPDQDMLTVLLTQPDDSGQLWRDDTVRDNLILLLFAGYDTSSCVLTLTISNIAKHPEVYQKLLDEHEPIMARKEKGEPLTMEDLRSMTYTWRVIQETMRQTTIVPLGFRQALEDFEYNGFTVRKGWKLFWTQERMNKEPAFFKDPDSFDPSRFNPGGGPAPYVFLPFGAGPRSCPGQEFAKMEILTFLHHFLKNFEWSLVDPDERVIRIYMPRTPKGSPIRISKRKAF